VTSNPPPTSLYTQVEHRLVSFSDTSSKVVFWSVELEHSPPSNITLWIRRNVALMRRALVMLRAKKNRRRERQITILPDQMVEHTAISPMTYPAPRPHPYHITNYSNAERGFARFFIWRGGRGSALLKRATRAFGGYK